MKEFKVEELTLKQIFNYISVMNKLVEEGIIKFNKNKAACTVCFDKASEIIEEQNVKYQKAINKSIDKLLCWGEVLDPIFQKELLEILESVKK